jgi:hypothetical protein
MWNAGIRAAASLGPHRDTRGDTRMSAEWEPSEAEIEAEALRVFQWAFPPHSDQDQKRDWRPTREACRKDARRRLMEREPEFSIDAGAAGDDEDIPWASPEIRESYEAALGRFMLAFNAVDNLLTEVIETVLTRLQRTELIKQCTKQNFALKLLVLELLKASSEGDGIANIAIEPMRELAIHRNKVAHGHFDQNPFDGTYEVISKNVPHDYPTEKLDSLTAAAEAAIGALRHAEAVYDFKDVPP